MRSLDHGPPGLGGITARSRPGRETREKTTAGEISAKVETGNVTCEVKRHVSWLNFGPTVRAFFFCAPVSRLK
jgi:hypothetical protein